jgi:hypothetical protein
MAQATFTFETDRAQKRVAALIPERVFRAIQRSANRSGVPMSEAAEYYLRVGFEERVKLFKLERDEGIPAALPPPLTRRVARQVKLKVSERDLMRLLRLADLEFETLGIATGRVLMLGCQKLSGVAHSGEADRLDVE